MMRMMVLFRTSRLRGPWGIVSVSGRRSWIEIESQAMNMCLKGSGMMFFSVSAGYTLLKYESSIMVRQCWPFLQSSDQLSPVLHRVSVGQYIHG